MTEISKITVYTRLLDELTALASRAAAAILAVPATALAPRHKADLSPVTAADEASEGIILAGLRTILPGVPVVSEEAAAGHPPSGQQRAQFLLVDPLDGTRELLAGRDEFTVNIALVTNGAPILGLVAAPARDLFWRGIVGKGAERLKIRSGAQPNAASERSPLRTRTPPPAGQVALVSRSHLDPETERYLAAIKPAEKIACGSSLKFCRLAEGAADIYPRLSPTSEWDVAAGHAVLAAAGGIVTAPDGAPLAYGKYADCRIPAFIARGSARLAKDL